MTLVERVLAHDIRIADYQKYSQALDVHSFSTFVVRALYPFFHRLAINEVVFKQSKTSSTSIVGDFSMLESISVVIQMFFLVLWTVFIFS